MIKTTGKMFLSLSASWPEGMTVTEAKKRGSQFLQGEMFLFTSGNLKLIPVDLAVERESALLITWAFMRAVRVCWKKRRQQAPFH